MNFKILFSAFSFFGSSGMNIPELPNIISLLYKKFSDQPWAALLYEWENIIFSLFISISISILFSLAAKKRELIPSGIQNFVEWGVEHFQNFVVEILGEDGKKFVPLLGTLFIFILTMNWMVLIPFMKSPTSSLNITIALALCVFTIVQFLNIKNHGLFGYIYHLMGSPKDLIGWLIVPLMFPIELLTQFTRPLTLALRLFGNVTGEDVMIGAAALFGTALLSTISPVGLPLQIPFMFLALLTGLMQAMVFTLLSTIYILLTEAEKEDYPSTVT